MVDQDTVQRDGSPPRRLQVWALCRITGRPGTAVRPHETAGWLWLSHDFAQAALWAQVAAPTTCPACAEQDTRGPIRSAA